MREKTKQEIINKVYDRLKEYVARCVQGEWDDHERRTSRWMEDLEDKISEIKRIMVKEKWVIVDEPSSETISAMLENGWEIAEVKNGPRARLDGEGGIVKVDVKEYLFKASPKFGVSIPVIENGKIVRFKGEKGESTKD